jgi:hypothetical protein
MAAADLNGDTVGGSVGGSWVVPEVCCFPVGGSPWVVPEVCCFPRGPWVVPEVCCFPRGPWVVGMSRRLSKLLSDGGSWRHYYEASS